MENKNSLDFAVIESHKKREEFEDKCLVLWEIIEHIKKHVSSILRPSAVRSWRRLLSNFCYEGEFGLFPP